MSFSIGSGFTYPFAYNPHPMVRGEAERLIAEISGSQPLDALFCEGKMLGVLMVDVTGCEDMPGLVAEGLLHMPEVLLHAHEGESGSDGSRDLCCPVEGCVAFLHGFSGLAGGRALVSGFVPPIFDLTAPDGHFRQEEARISAISEEIACEKDPAKVADLSAERRKRSEALQKWLFEQFVVSNAHGQRRNILEVFAPRGIMPPGGTGECALPRMLQYAYLHGLRPLAFGEFWYGRPPKGELRRHGAFYPSCMGKCGPLLEFMLQGLEVEPNPMEAYSDYTFRNIPVLYEDDDIIVVDKPSGLLSVPGRIKAASLLVWLQRRERDLAARRGGSDALHTVPRFSATEVGSADVNVSADSCFDCRDDKPEITTVYSCHRLDMDTSGVMVFARNAKAQSHLQRQFENREVSKRYIALLSGADAACFQVPDRCRGLSVGQRGTISLPLAPDYYDRPRQMVDHENGKAAVTDYEVLEEREGGVLLVRFTPKTGRTHQLRVHAAHPDGLGRPILGDRLYGGGVAIVSPSASLGSAVLASADVSGSPSYTTVSSVSLPATSPTATASLDASDSPCTAQSRLCLHAESLTFSHPATGRPMTFTSSPDFL